MTRSPSQQGRYKRRKGAEIEREIVRRHKEIGIHAERVAPLQANKDSDSSDIDVYPDGKDNAPLCCEVKARKAMPKWLFEWLGENDALFIRPNGQAPFIVMPWDTYVRLVK